MNLSQIHYRTRGPSESTITHHHLFHIGIWVLKILSVFLDLHTGTCTCKEKPRGSHKPESLPG
jgi:hypothetical protein